MRRHSSDRDRPILVIPRKAKIEIPDAPASSSSASSSSASITIHASADPEASDSARATGKRRGEAAEAAFLARATHLGFGVLLPWGESSPYDAAVDFGRRLLRVQVKSAAAYNDGYTIKTTRSNGRVYTLDDIDFVVGYVVPEDIWYVIPVEALGSRATIKFHPHSRRLVKPMFEHYRDAWCLLDCPREKRGRNDTPKTCRSEEVGVKCAVCPKK
jgi:hypothetical protein